MATKDHQLFLKSNSFVNSNSFAANNDSQFSNINLNQNHQSSNCDFVQPKSKSNNDKKFASFKADTFVNDNHHKNESSKLWKKSSDNSCLESFIAEREARNQGKNDKRSVNSNSSTLSLHITAYENVVEAAKKDSTKKSKLPKAFVSSPEVQNPFELPRQIENDASSNDTPEVMQFKASQQLALTNQDVSSSLPAFTPTSDDNPPSVITQNGEQPETAKFGFDGKVKLLPIALLTPSRLAQAFQLDVNSLSITDDKQDGYIPIENGFFPALVSNKSYQVDGLPLVVENSSNCTIISRQNMNNDLKVIQGNQVLEVIEHTTADSQDLYEATTMLVHGPRAVHFLQSIAVICSLGPDPTLDVATLNPEIKARLADPGSFQASLSSLGNRLCNAFFNANRTMIKIRSWLKDLPEDFINVLELVEQNDNEKAQKALIHFCEDIKKIVDNCKKAAASTKKEFDECLLDINALSVAICSSKTVEGREKEIQEKIKEEYTIKMEEEKARGKRIKKEKEEATEKSKEWRQEYLKQLNSSTSLKEVILAFAMDAFSDIPKVLMQSMPQNAIASTINSIFKNFNSPEQEHVKSSKSMEIGAEINLLESLEKIGKSLADPVSMDDAIITDYISTLNDIQKFSISTKEGSALVEQAKKVQKFLQNCKDSFENGSLQIDLMKTEISTMKTSIENTVSTIRHAHEQQKREKAAALSHLEKLYHTQNERLKSVESHYKASEVEKEILRQEEEQNNKNITEFFCMLNSAGIDITNLEERIKCLKKGTACVANTKSSWVNVVDYFGMIDMFVENYIVKKAEAFVRQAQDPLSRKMLLKAAFTAAALCMEISNDSMIYTAVSKKHIMPIISSLNGKFCLEPVEAQQMYVQIQRSYSGMQTEVKEMIAKMQTEAQISLNDQMKQYAQKMEKAIDGIFSSVVKVFKKIITSSNPEFDAFEANFNIQKQSISQLAQQFRELIQKMKNMCSSDSRILKDIAKMKEQLSSHLDNVMSLNHNAQDLSVKGIKCKSGLEEKLNNYEQEKQKAESDRDTSMINMNSALKRVAELKNDRIIFEKELENKQREIRIGQKNVLYFFVMTLLKQIDEIEEKIKRIENAIKECDAQMSKVNDEVYEHREALAQKNYAIYQCKAEIEQAEEQQLQVRQKLKVISGWLKALNVWLDYLITLEPQVERVERHIGYNENSLRNAIQDLKNDVNKNFTAAIENEVNMLAPLPRNNQERPCRIQ